MVNRLQNEGDRFKYGYGYNTRPDKQRDGENYRRTDSCVIISQPITECYCELS